MAFYMVWTNFACFNFRSARMLCSLRMFWKLYLTQLSCMKLLPRAYRGWLRYICMMKQLLSFFLYVIFYSHWDLIWNLPQTLPTWARLQGCMMKPYSCSVVGFCLCLVICMLNKPGFYWCFPFYKFLFLIDTYV